MRFRRIHIPAYGPFTDLALDFPAGGPGFHLIYGRNEAGKSSLLRAIRDLLYGIHAQTADNFLHDYRDLRISAEIENRAGHRLAMQRRKGRSNTLLDGAGNPLADDALAPFIGTVDRDFFTTMFGLGAEELRQGALDLLRGRGDLGQALFSASFAGTPIHRVLERLDEEARALFNGRARIGVSLRPAVERYEAAMRDSKQALVKPEAWENVVNELDAARQGRAALDAELHAARGRQDWLRRCLDALPNLGQLREVDARLRDLPPLPTLPEGYPAVAAAAREGLDRAERALRELRQRIDTLRARRATLSPREAVLAHAAEIDALAQGLAVYRQDREALAAETAEAARAQARLRSGLLDLGLADDPAAIAGMRLSLSEQQALRDAAATLSTAERDSEAQRREHERVQAELERIARRLDHLRVSGNDGLREALAATAHAATLAQTLAGKEAALEGLARRLSSQGRLLSAFDGDAQALYALNMPAAARLRDFEAGAADLASRERRLEEATQTATRRLRELKSKLERLETRGALPSPDDLEHARALREAGWRQVLACWKAGEAEPDWEGVPLALSYPDAVRRADALADRLREEADAVAQAEELRAQIREAEALNEELGREDLRLDQARQEWRQEWSNLCASIGLTVMSPGEMLEWREQWLEFRARHEAWSEASDGLQAARRDIATAEQALRPVLDMAAGTLAELRERAQRQVEEATQAQGERRTLLARQEELQVEGEALARRRIALDEALALARARWRAHPLGGDNPPEHALDLLAARLDLVAAHDAWTRLCATRADRQARLETYEGKVHALVATLRADTASDRPGAQSGPETGFSAEVEVNALSEALTRARALRERRTQVDEDLEQLLDGQAPAERAVVDARATLTALLAQAGVADATALERLLGDLAARQRLLDERDRLRASLHIQSRGEALDAFIARVRAEDGETLKTEADALAERIREGEARRDQILQVLARAEDARARLDASGADAAEFLQQASHAAARIRQDAARYLRLRLATRFLNNQIESFRERNQGPLLARAGALFSAMTGGSFSALGADYDVNDQPTLVGLKARTKIPVEGMSEGTRDQLYLALRLAAIEQHLVNHEPMPLILDDLLITFDDDRCRAILPLLRDLAERTQVMLFTHHRHLLDLAREVLPGEAMRVHELDGTGTPAP